MKVFRIGNYPKSEKEFKEAVRIATEYIIKFVGEEYRQQVEEKIASISFVTIVPAGKDNSIRDNYIRLMKDIFYRDKYFYLDYEFDQMDHAYNEAAKIISVKNADELSDKIIGAFYRLSDFNDEYKIGSFDDTKKYLQNNLEKVKGAFAADYKFYQQFCFFPEKKKSKGRVNYPGVIALEVFKEYFGESDKPLNEFSALFCKTLLERDGVMLSKPIIQRDISSFLSKYFGKETSCGEFCKKFGDKLDEAQEDYKFKIKILNKAIDKTQSQGVAELSPQLYRYIIKNLADGSMNVINEIVKSLYLEQSNTIFACHCQCIDKDIKKLVNQQLGHHFIFLPVEITQTDLIHEILHAVTSSLSFTEVVENGIKYAELKEKTGLDLVSEDISVSLNEAVTQYMALEIGDMLKKDGVQLLEDKDYLYCLYDYAMPVVGQFIGENLDILLKASFANEEDMFQFIDKEDFDLLCEDFKLVLDRAMNYGQNRAKVDFSGKQFAKVMSDLQKLSEKFDKKRKQEDKFFE